MSYVKKKPAHVTCRECRAEIAVQPGAGRIPTFCSANCRVAYTSKHGPANKRRTRTELSVAHLAPTLRRACEHLISVGAVPYLPSHPDLSTWGILALLKDGSIARTHVTPHNPPSPAPPNTDLVVRFDSEKAYHYFPGTQNTPANDKPGRG